MSGWVTQTHMAEALHMNNVAVGQYDVDGVTASKRILAWVKPVVCPNSNPAPPLGQQHHMIIRHSEAPQR